MPRFFKVGEAAKYVGRSVRRMQELDRTGELIAHRTETGRRYYTQEQLDAWLGLTPSYPQKKTVAYARVSSYQQKDGLQNQMNFIVQYANGAGLILDECISDIGSGMNYDRPKWNKLLKDVEAGLVGQIIVTYKDRFTRFGFEWYDRFCHDHGCEITVLNNPATSPDEEMTEDLISIIHVFSCRLYGLRRYKTKMEKDPALTKAEKKRGED